MSCEQQALLEHQATWRESPGNARVGLGGGAVLCLTALRSGGCTCKVSSLSVRPQAWPVSRGPSCRAHTLMSTGS